MDIKRFEIFPILQSIRVNERIGFQITCIEVNNNDLYLGTLDSFIFCYKNALEYKTANLDSPLYKYLSFKKPILQMKILSVLDRLLCVSDSTLVGLNLKNLEINNNLRVKNVYAFCLNENPISMDPFSIELCLVKKKCISICQMQSDKISVLKEISLPEQPLLASMDGYFVCIATESNYYMIDWQSGTSQLLFSNETNSFMRPIIKHVSRNEFLINGFSHLGIFIKTSGISERPPVDWGMEVQRIAYSYPYILCLKKYSISIISVIDSKLKEEFMFENGVYIDNFEGQILIASNESVFYLRRIPWEDQIDSLLENGKSQEAIDLCASLYETGLISNLDLSYAKLVKVKAGLMELSRDNFDAAQNYLIESEFDIEIFLSCHPSINTYLQLEPEESDFTKTMLNEVKEKIQNNPSFYSSFLISYIKELMSQGKFLYTSIATKINTCLLILYLGDIPKNFDLIEHLFASQFKFDFKSIETYLEDHQMYHMMALLYSHRCEHFESAIDLWKRMENGLLKDSHYTGFRNLSNLLKKCANSKLILNHIEFILERNQDKAVEVLMENTKVDGEKFSILDPEHVITLLHKYRRALIIYLEFLVFQLRIKNPHIHTNLAILYIEIISLQQETEEQDSSLCESIHQKLKNLLHVSNFYDDQKVLACLLKNGLYYESATQYGKIGNHMKAFEIYLNKYMDHEQSLKHCLQYSNGNEKIFNTLLSVYLELYHKNVPEIMEPLLNFLNHSKCRFELTDLLRQLPSDWPLHRIQRLLANNTRATLGQKFRSSMGKALSLSQLERVKREQRQLTRKPIHVDKDSVCIICNMQLFGDSKFVWIPSSECFLHDYCFAPSS